MRYEVLEDYDLGGTALNIVYPPTRIHSKRVSMLIERIVARLATDNTA
jgi:hypothetical protein